MHRYFLVSARGEIYRDLAVDKIYIVSKISKATKLITRRDLHYMFSPAAKSENT